MTGDNSIVWVDKKTLDVVSIIAGKDGLDYTFIEVGRSSDEGVLSPKEDKKVYTKY